jgi:hypothetical protein
MGLTPNEALLADCGPVPIRHVMKLSARRGWTFNCPCVACCPLGAGPGTASRLLGRHGGFRC